MSSLRFMATVRAVKDLCRTTSRRFILIPAVTEVRSGRILAGAGFFDMAIDLAADGWGSAVTERGLLIVTRSKIDA